MTTRITNSMLQRSVLGDIQAAADKLSRTQQQLSSGKQLTRPSDDPFATSRALLYRNELEAGDQYKRNVDDASAWQTTTDAALSQISDFGHRARDLVVQAANGSSGQVANNAIATEIDQLIESVKSEANTQYAGRYVFGGAKTTTAPYKSGADDTYYGDQSALGREIGPGVSVQLNVDGLSSVGGVNAAGVNTGLIGALRQIASDLRGVAPGDPTRLTNGDIKLLDTSLDQLMNQRAIVGARTNRLDSASSRLDELQQATTKLLSDTEDVDMAKAYTDYSQQTAVYQAALKSGASLIQPSLLDFLR
ncbi:MAG: flagellar hook-associated protein 3 FlgL [Actinomycetota bacterium]